MRITKVMIRYFIGVLILLLVAVYTKNVKRKLAIVDCGTNSYSFLRTGQYMDYYGSLKKTMALDMVATSDGGIVMIHNYASTTIRVIKLTASAKVQWLTTTLIPDAPSLVFEKIVVLADNVQGILYLFAISDSSGTSKYLVRLNLSTGKKLDVTQITDAVDTRATLDFALRMNNGLIYTLGTQNLGTSGNAGVLYLNLSTAIISVKTSSLSGLMKDMTINAVSQKDSKTLIMSVTDTTGNNYIYEYACSDTEDKWTNTAGGLINSVAPIKLIYHTGTGNIIGISEYSFYIFQNTNQLVVENSMAYALVDITTTNDEKNILAFTKSEQTTSFVDFNPSTGCCEALVTAEKVDFAIGYKVVKAIGVDQYWTLEKSSKINGYPAAIRMQNIKSSDCPEGQSSYYHQECLPLLTAGCHPNCNNKCLVAGSTEHCLASPLDNNVVRLQLSTRARVNGAIIGQDGTTQTLLTSGCHPLCAGICTVANSPNSCGTTCNHADPYIDDSQESLGKCACKTGYFFSTNTSRCVRNKCSLGCLYDECGALDTDCIKCNLDYTATEKSSFMSCVCPSPFLESTTQHACVQNNCNGACFMDECSISSKDMCISCSKTNVDSSANGNYFTCTCQSNYVLSGGFCISSSMKCDLSCASGKCTTENSQGKCTSCATGYSGTRSASGEIECVQNCNEGQAITTSGCKPIIKTDCHALCGSEGCTEKNNQEACVKCWNQETIISTKFYNPIKCECKQGTTLYNSICSINSLDCSPNCLSQKCTVSGKSDKCGDCDTSSYITTKMSTGEYSCTACSKGLVLIKNSCVDISQYTSCYALCSGGCSANNDNTACMDCANIKNINKETGYQLVKCSCKSGTLIEGLCVLYSNCAPLCGGACTQEKSSSSCYSIPAGTHCTKNADSKDYTCDSCLESFVKTIDGCKKILTEDCHSMCSGGCTAVGSSSSCINCVSATGIKSDTLYGPTKCYCNNGGSWLNGRCVITSDCDPLCKGQCTQKNKPKFCAQSPEGTKCTGPDEYLDYSCTECIEGYVLTRAGCAKIISDSCAGQCNGFCTAKYSPEACIDCLPRTGLATKTGYDPVKCECTNGGTFSNGYCVLTSDCSPYCDGQCTATKDSVHCAKYPDGTECIQDLTTKDYNCSACSEKYSITRTKCKLIITDESCSGYCGSKGCTTKQDNFACVDCKPVTGMTSIGGYDPLKCICNNGGDFLGGRCVISSTDCDRLCDGKCTEKKNSKKCAQIADGTDCNLEPSTMDYICTKCLANYALTRTKCAYIDPSLTCADVCLKSAGCTKASNSEACIDCLPITGMGKINDKDPYECKCTNGGTFKEGYCLIETDCDPICEGKCTKQKSTANCAKKPEGADCTNDAITGDYSCSKCLSNYALTRTGCKLITNDGCADECSGGCTLAGSKEACVKCKSGNGMDEKQGYDSMKCECTNEGTINKTTGLCAIQSSSCHSLCGGLCTKKSDSNFCAQVIQGTKCTKNPTNDWSCTECETNYVLTEKGCVLHYDDGCANQCSDGCIEQGSSLKCTNCKSITGLQATKKVGYVECACSNGGTWDDSTKTCLIKEGCDPICKNKCTAINSKENCVGEPEGAECTDGTNIGDKVCKTCKATHTYVQAKGCLEIKNSPSCAAECADNKCTIISNNNACVSCKKRTNLKSDPTGEPYKCTCQDGFDFDGDYCLAKSGCDPLCAGKCTTAGSANSCTQKPTGTVCNEANEYGEYSCTNCMSEYIKLKTGCKYVYKEDCSGECLVENGCLAKNSNTQCVVCKNITNMVSAAQTEAPLTCSCDSGTVYSDGHCILTNGDLCYPICQKKCTVKNSDKNCAFIPPGTVCSQPDSKGDYSCSGCSSPDYVMTRKGCKKIDFSLACSPLCSAKGCTAENDPYACVECIDITGIDTKTDYDPKYCSCQAGSTFDTNTKLCVINSNQCHLLCKNKCTEIKNSSSCAQAPEGSLCQEKDSKGNFICTGCAPNYIMTRTGCAIIFKDGCFSGCQAEFGCTIAQNDASCVKCLDITGMLSTSNMDPYQCRCNNGGNFNDKLCVIKSGCDKLCAGECTQKNNKLFCAKKPDGTICTGPSDKGDYSCSSCDSNYALTLAGCAEKITSGCSPLCSNDGCTKINDALSCISCRAGDEILAETDYNPYKCSCKYGVAQSGECIITKNCHPLCAGKCTAINDKNKCAEIPTGSECTKNEDNTYTCNTCSTNFALRLTGCSPSTVTPCSSLCNSTAGCTATNDPESCVSCRSGDEISTIDGFNPKKCICKDGTGPSGKCILKTGCHPLCGGSCTMANSAENCAIIPTGTICEINDKTKDYECKKCDNNYILTRTSCAEIKTTGCHIACSGGCTKISDNTACVSCVQNTGVESTSGYDPNKCDCALGSEFTIRSDDPTKFYCMIKNGDLCSLLCNKKCTKANSDSACAQHAEGVNCIQNPNNGNWECSTCDPGYANTTTGCKLIDKNLQCSELCSDAGCTATSSSSCVACKGVTGMKTEDLYDPKKCSCEDGTTFKDGYCMLTESSKCHPICQNKCTKENSVLYCAQNPPNTICEKNLNTNDYNCKNCDNNYVLVKSSGCTQVLDENCANECDINKKCTKVQDNTACVDCPKRTGMISSTDGFPMKCTCGKDIPYTNGYCLITVGCHDRCQKKCTKVSDSNYCAWEPTGTQCTQDPINLDYKCDSCKEGYVDLVGYGCVEKLLSASCLNLCSNVGCPSILSKEACFECKPITNMNEENHSVKIFDGNYLKKCSCAAGTEYEDGYCMIKKDCDPYCGGKCTKVKNKLYCAQKKEGTTCTQDITTKDFNCQECEKNYVLVTSLSFPQGCTKLLDDSNQCSTKCTSEGCTSSASSACVGCKPVTGMIATDEGAPKNCSCQTGNWNGKYCLITTNCHKFCNGECTVEKDAAHCAKAPTGTVCVQDITTGDYHCTGCDKGYVEIDTGCVPILVDNCDGKCLSCTIENSDKACVNCQPFTGIQTLQGSPKACSCPNGISFTKGYCLITSGCHNLCGGECTLANDPVHCAKKPDGTDCVKDATTNDYNCKGCLATHIELPSKGCVEILKGSCNDTCLPDSGCTASTNDACIDCKSITNMKKEAGFSPYKCYCEKGEYENGRCVLKNNPKCHPLCKGKCTKENDQNFCAQEPEGTNCKLNAASNDFICTDCKNNYILLSDGCALIYPSESCKPICNKGCTDKNSESACIDCYSITSMDAQAEYRPKKCSCKKGEFTIYKDNPYCLLKDNCHSICQGFCTETNNENNCAYNPPGTICQKSASTGDYSCSKCDDNYVFVPTKGCVLKLTVNCDKICSSGCTVESSNEACVSCPKITGIISNNSDIYFPIKCSCAEGTTYKNGYCLISNDCHPRCKGACTKKKDENFCAQEPEGTSCTKNLETGDYSCTSCKDGYIDLPLSGCTEIFKSGCDGRCSSDGCTVKGSNNDCLKCKKLTNLKEEANNGLVKCNCGIGEFKEGHCLITENCHSLCAGKCTQQNTQNYCAQQPEGTECSFSEITEDFSCKKCAINYTLLSKGCVPIIYKKCGDLCSDAGCTEEGNNNACVGCSSNTGVGIEENNSPLRCFCKTGSNTNGICLITKDCAPICDNACTIIKNENNCAKKPDHAVCTLNKITNDYACNECEKYYSNTQTGCKLIITDNTCHENCGNQGCTAPSDLNSCVNCKYITGMKTLSGANPNNCSCETGKYTNGYCLIESGCHNLCKGKCTKVGDANFCAQSPPNTECSPANDKGDIACTMCSNGYALTENGCAKIINTNCHPLCLQASGCTAENNEKACVSCAVVTNIAKDESFNPTKCYCDKGSELKNGLCVFSSECHQYCSNSCTKKGDNGYCANAIPGGDCSLNPTGEYSCPKCLANKAYNDEAKKCLDIIYKGCGDLCDGCTEAGSNSLCSKCLQGDNINELSGYSPVKCTCSDKTKSLDGSLCGYTQDCHALCNGKCTKKDSNLHCQKCIDNMSGVLQSDRTYKCQECNEGYFLDENICKKIIKIGCHPLCDSSGCTIENNPDSCLKCANIPSITSASVGNLTKCSCNKDTAFNAKYNLCVVKNNSLCGNLCNPDCVKLNDNDYCLDGCKVVINLVFVQQNNLITACIILPYTANFTMTGDPKDRCKGLSFSASSLPEDKAVNSKYKWEITFIAPSYFIPKPFTSSLTSLTLTQQNLTLPYSAIPPGITLNVTVTASESTGFRANKSNLYAIPYSDNLYCGPCQLNDRSSCDNFKGTCWNNYLDVTEKPKLNSVPCLNQMSKICFNIWLLNGQSDFQCREYVSVLNFTAMTIKPTALSAKQTVETYTDIIITFNMDINYYSIEDCALVIASTTMKNLEGQNPICMWTSAKTYKVSYTPSKSYLSSITLRGDSIYSAYPYAQYPMSETTFSLEIPKVTYNVDLSAPNSVTPTMPLVMSLTAGPDGPYVWKYLWIITYTSGNYTDSEKQTAEEYFAQYKTYSDKYRMISIPSNYLLKDSKLKVVTNTINTYITSVFSNEATISITNTNSVGVGVSALSSITENLYGNQRNNIELNINSGTTSGQSEGSSSGIPQGKITVKFEVKSGSSKSQINTHGTEETAIENTLNIRYSSIKMVSFSEADGFKYYTYYLVTVFVTDSNNSTTNDSFTVFLTKQPPSCKITSPGYALNPNSNNNFLGNGSTIYASNGDEIMYLWSCDSCTTLQSNTACTCDIFRSNSERKGSSVTIYKSTLKDFARYIISFAITVKTAGYARSCSTTTEFITLNQARSGAIAEQLNGYGGSNVSKSDVYIGAAIMGSDLENDVKGYKWELLEIESKVNKSLNYSIKNSYFAKILKTEYGINIAGRRLLQATNDSSIPEYLIPRILASPQSLPPILGISKDDMLPKTRYMYSVKIDYNGNKKSVFSSVDITTPPNAVTREFNIAPLSGTEYLTQFVYSFYATATSDKDDAMFQLFRQDCPNIARDNSTLIPFSMKMRNLNSITSIMAPGDSSCDYQVLITLKVTIEDKEEMYNKTIRIAEEQEAGLTQKRVESFLSELESDLSQRGLPQALTMLHQLAVYCIYSNIETVSRIINIMKKYDTDMFSIIMSSFDSVEKVAFLMHAMQILQSVLRAGPTVINTDMVNIMIGKMNTFTKAIITVSGGSSAIETAIQTLDRIVNLNSTSILTRQHFVNISSLLNNLIDLKLAGLIPGGHTYMDENPHISMKMKCVQYSPSLDFNINGDISNQTFKLSSGPTFVLSNKTAKCLSTSCTLCIVLTSYSFNPYPVIKNNTNIHLASLRSNSLADGRIKNTTVYNIYKDLKNTNKLDSVVDKVTMSSKLIQLSFHIATYDMLSRQSLSPVNITLETLLPGQEISTEIQIQSPLSKYSPIIPLYYQVASDSWTNEGCYVDNNVTVNGSNSTEEMLYKNDLKKPLVKCSYLTTFNSSIVQRQAISLTVDTIYNINEIIIKGNYQDPIEDPYIDKEWLNYIPIMLCSAFILVAIVGSIMLVVWELSQKTEILRDSLADYFEKPGCKSESRRTLLQRIAMYLIELKRKRYSDMAEKPRPQQPQGTLVSFPRRADDVLPSLPPLHAESSPQNPSEWEESPRILIVPRMKNTVLEDNEEKEVKLIYDKYAKEKLANEVPQKEENKKGEDDRSAKKSEDKKPVECSNELINQMYSCPHMRIVSALYLDKQENDMKGTWCGLIKSEHTWLSIYYNAGILNPRYVRLMTLCLVLIGELFITRLFFDKTDSVQIHKDWTGFLRSMFLAAFVAIIAMAGMKLFWNFFLIEKCPTNENTVEEKHNLEIKNMALWLFGFAFACACAGACAWRISIDALDANDQALYKWLYSFLLCVCLELTLVEGLKMFCKVWIHLLLMNKATSKALLKGCGRAFALVVDFCYYYL